MADFDGVEILLVEDNDQDADLTMRALDKCSFNNKRYRVKDGVEAIDFIRGLGTFAGRDLREQPRLILLDLGMPRMDGIEVLRVLKADKEAQRIPVVIMTVSNQEKELSECYGLGANGFVSKPLGLEELTKAVGRIGMYWLLANRVV